jgi:opacity protein-like surface antigen
MNKKFAALLTCLFVGLFLTGTAWSENLYTSGADANDSYVTLKAGLYSPTGDLKDANFDNNAFNGEVAIGRNFTQYFGMEAGIGRFATKATYSGYDSTIGNYNETDEVSVWPVTFTLKGIIPNLNPLSFYYGAGIGLYIARAKADFTSDVIRLSASDNDNVLGFHVLVGLEYNFATNVFWGIEAKNIWTKNLNFSEVVSGIPIGVETDLNGYNIAAKIGFRF